MADTFSETVEWLAPVAPRLRLCPFLRMVQPGSTLGTSGVGSKPPRKALPFDSAAPGWTLAFWLLPLMSFHHHFDSSHVNMPLSKIATKNALRKLVLLPTPCFSLVLGLWEEVGVAGLAPGWNEAGSRVL